MKESELDLVVAGTDDALAMVECGATELPEAVILDALDLAHQEIKKIIALQHEIVAELGVVKAEFVAEPKPWPEDFAEALKQPLDRRTRVKPSRCAASSSRTTPSKRSATKALAELSEEEADEKTSWVKNDLRIDGQSDHPRDHPRRAPAPRRPRLRRDPAGLGCETGVLPRAHGSALFTRGETQALVTCTLGTSDDTQLIEAFEGDSRNAVHAALQLPAVLGR